MERIQPFFKLNKRKCLLECWRGSYPSFYYLNDDEIPIVEKLLDRDLMSALLYRTSKNKGISELCNDIIEQRG